jgi:hypothetical protein
MNMQHQLLYLNKSFTLLSAEQEFIIHPAALGLLPITPEAALRSFMCSFEITNYYLFLKTLSLNGNDNSNTLRESDEEALKPYTFQDKRVYYNGAILVGAGPLKDYVIKYNDAYFSYQSVYELIFENGYLVTTIDHSRAMVRIRKNLELGFRSLSNKNDARCIKHFMKSTFIGDYGLFSSSNKRLKYLKKMKEVYLLRK